jgi:hypothetical protein
MALTSKGGSGDSPHHELWMRLGHQTLTLRYLAYTLLIVGFFLRQNNWQAPLLSGIVLVIFVLSMAGGWYHDRRLCERCVANLPLNAPKQAAKRIWMFWLTHHWPLMFVALFINLGVGVAFAVLSQREMIKFGLASFFILLMLFTHTVATHQRFQPWCRWCRRDDGPGNDTFEPAPDPDPAVTPERDQTRV